MSTGELGRLERIDPRSVWAHEAHDFTRWLLQNGDALAEVLGIDIELTHAEHPVGRYAVDLIGRDLSNDCVLIVENQLEATDHDHLGKLITYAAGTNAETVVWIAPSIREEHRDAIDLLNDMGGDVRFFALTLSAVRIGDSEPAPLIEIQASPNDWHRAVSAAARAAAGVSGKAESYVEYWNLFRDMIRADHPDWTRSRTDIRTNWFDMPCPFKGGPHFALSFAQGGRTRVELYIDNSDPAEIEQIEDAFGGPLEWERLHSRRASRIATYDVGDVSDHDDHERVAFWMKASLERLRAALDVVAAEVMAELG